MMRQSAYPFLRTFFHRIRTPLMGLFLGTSFLAHSTYATQDHDSEVIKASKSQARGMALAFQTATNKMMPSVIKVLAKRTDADPLLDELNLLDEESSQDYDVGSGVIISEDGLCVTNHHVIRKAKSIVAELSDGRRLIGKDPRSDEMSDLAIFQLSSPDPLPAATMGNSDELSVGDWVIAIGSPFNLDQTVSVGIISSKGRPMQLGRLRLGQLLQTDAAINPGNSGGPLLDIEGNLIGINTLISSTSGFFQGVGFAIPIRRVQWVVKELVANGKVSRSRIGVQTFQIPQDIAQSLRIPVRSGVYVGKVTSDSAAEKAGVMVGDIITEIAEHKVFSPADFRTVVEQLPSDRSYPMRLLREGESIVLEVQPTPIPDRQ